MTGTIELGLVLTHACNLACGYCYTGEKKRVRMPLDVARRALQFGFDTAARSGARLQLTFFGGEPLLELDRLLELAGLAREHSRTAGCGLVMQVTTNGTLLTAEAVRGLGELGVHIALSLDGTRAQHESARPRKGGGSSYDATLRALHLLLEARDHAPFDVISVIDPGTVHALGDGVRELVDLGVDALSLNMNWGGAWHDADLDVLERELEIVAAVFVACVRRGRWVRIQPLESALSGLVQLGRVPATSCGSGSRRLAIAPSGRIYGCARAVGDDTGRGAIGHLDHGFTAPAQLEHACTCARSEETGDHRADGPIKLRHDRAVERVAQRVAALLQSEYTLVEVAEQGRTP